MIKPIMHEPRLLEHVNFVINLLGQVDLSTQKIAKVLSNPAEEKEKGRGKAEEKGGRGEAKEAGGRGETAAAATRARDA